MKYFLAFLLTTMLLPRVAKADFIPDGVHTVSNCLAVNNIADYPDYDFVWKGEGYRGTPLSAKITNGDSVCDVAHSYALLAIKKTNWSKVVYKTSAPDENGDPAVQWIQDPQNTNLFIASNYAVEFDRFAPDTSSVKTIYTTVHIDFVSDTGVTAHTAETLSTDSEGELNPAMKRPAPIGDEETEANNPLSTLSPTAKVLIALGVLGLGAVCYAWKKK